VPWRQKYFLRIIFSRVNNYLLKKITSNKRCKSLSHSLHNSCYELLLCKHSLLYLTFALFVTFRCIKFHLFYVKYILASTPYVPNLTVAYVPNLPQNVPNLTGASNVPKIEQYRYYGSVNLAGHLHL
jgi:hypothetical protein